MQIKYVPVYKRINVYYCGKTLEHLKQKTYQKKSPAYSKSRVISSCSENSRFSFLILITQR